MAELTPERKAYWLSIGFKERQLRALINDEKCAIKCFKNNFKYPENYNCNILSIMLRQAKIRLTAYRHALNRLKGMDRVVVPKRIFIDNYCGISTKCTRCKCGRLIPHFENYCSDCGRRILWEKVK